MSSIQFHVQPALPILVPAAYGLLLLVFAPAFRRMQRWLAGVALLGLGMTGVAALSLWRALPEVGGAVETAGIPGLLLIRADALSVFLDLLFVLVGALAVLAAPAYFDRAGTHHPELYPLILLAVAGMTMMVGSEHLVVILIGLETLSLSLYVLAGGFRDRPRSVEAALKYFILGAFASGFLIYGLALLYGATGSLHLRTLGASLAGQGNAASSNLLLLAGLALALIGLAFKVAVVPFHTWCPDVYQGAPAPITAFMAAGTKAAAFAVLVRVVATGLGGEGPGEIALSWKSLLTALAILTMCVGNVLALVQQSIKRMLAYSSIAHAGYLLIAVVALLGVDGPGDPSVALQALGFYLVSYTLMTMGAFVVVGRISGGDRDADHLSHYAGLSGRRPVLALAMGVFMISLIGIPPTGGFVGKYYLFLAAMDSRLYLLAAVGVLNAVVAAAYYLRVVVAMYMKPPEPELEPAAGSDLGATLALALAAGGTLLLGLWPGVLLDWSAALYAGLTPLGLLSLVP